MRKPALAAIVVAALLLPPRTRSDDPASAGVSTPAASDAPLLEVAAPAPPPERWLKLKWTWNGESTPVYVYSEKQVIATARRIDFLERACAKAEVDAQIETAKKTIPAWVWIVSGAVVGAGATWAVTR